MPRPRDTASFFHGLFFVGVGIIDIVLRDGRGELGWIFGIGGAVRVALSFFVVWSTPGEASGPGTLRATPAKRFRATGWPPSKDPDAYR